MKTLALLRHAKPEPLLVPEQDFNRSLLPKGKADAAVMGQVLKTHTHSFDLILTSPAKRAMMTAQIIVKALGSDESKISTQDEIYNAHYTTLRDIVFELDNNLESVLLVGHNPGFTELSQQLSKESIYDLPTCGLVILQFATDDWAEIKRQNSATVLFDYPKRH